MRYLSSVFILAVFLLSCSPESFFDQELAVDPDTWEYNQSHDFEMTILDTTKIYDMHLTLSHGESYAYENLYLKIITEFPTIEHREESLNIQMADKAGNWIGNCKSGNCKLKVYLLENFRFPEEGDYNFSFEQYTRDSVLTDIQALQLTLYEKPKTS